MFLSFQISLITSMTSVRTTFRGVAGVVVTLIHHSKVLLDGFQLGGLSPGSATHVATQPQILLVYRHSEMRWKEFSIVALHSGQKGLWSQPRRASLSEVQTRFCVMSQVKNLALGSAQVFQIEQILGAVVQPKNCAL